MAGYQPLSQPLSSRFRCGFEPTREPSEFLNIPNQIEKGCATWNMFLQSSPELDVLRAFAISPLSSSPFESIPMEIIQRITELLVHSGPEKSPSATNLKDLLALRETSKRLLSAVSYVFTRIPAWARKLRHVSFMVSRFSLRTLAGLLQHSDFVNQMITVSITSHRIVTNIDSRYFSCTDEALREQMLDSQMWFEEHEALPLLVEIFERLKDAPNLKEIRVGALSSSSSFISKENNDDCPEPWGIDHLWLLLQRGKPLEGERTYRRKSHYNKLLVFAVTNNHEIRKTMPIVLAALHNTHFNRRIVYLRLCPEFADVEGSFQRLNLSEQKQRYLYETVVKGVSISATDTVSSSIFHLLETARNVESIKIQGCPWYQRCVACTDLATLLFSQDYSHLERLHISSLNCPKLELVSFLEKHRRTMQRVQLEKISLDSSTETYNTLDHELASLQGFRFVHIGYRNSKICSHHGSGYCICPGPVVRTPYLSIPYWQYSTEENETEGKSYN